MHILAVYIFWLSKHLSEVTGTGIRIKKEILVRLPMKSALKSASCCLSILLLVAATDGFAKQRPQVNIENAPPMVAANITHHLSLGDERCNISERRARTLMDAADKKITAALRALGYYRATWQKEILFTQDCWQLNLSLEPGEPVTLVRIDIDIEGEAKQDPVFNRLLENSPLQVGNQLIHSEYDAFKTTLQKAASQRGYVESHFSTQQLLVSIKDNSAEIKLTFNSGPRYAFGPVIFEQEIFDESFLTRYLPFADQQPFDTNALGSFQQSLINSRYFNDVSVLQLPANADSHEIPVQVVLTPAAHYSTSFGLGAATDTGPRGSVSFKNNRANRSGQRYDANLELSPVESAFNFDYQIPLLRPISEQVRLKAGWEHVDTDTSKNNTWSIGASKTTMARNWLQTIDLAYHVESFTVADDKATTRLVIPGINWHRSHANNMAYPTSGWRLQGSVRGSSEQLGSDLSFLQLRGSAKYILGIGSGRLLSRFDAGTSLVNQFSVLPASFRFFAGGDSSVRGYDYQELGPVNNSNEVIGGKHLLTASMEYEYPVFKKYGLAVFYDVGNAFDNSQFTLKRSLGFGGRWRSPIGPVRVDIAFPQGDDQSFRVHLSMGPDL